MCLFAGNLSVLTSAGSLDVQAFKYRAFRHMYPMNIRCKSRDLYIKIKMPAIFILIRKYIYHQRVLSPDFGNCIEGRQQYNNLLKQDFIYNFALKVLLVKYYSDYRLQKAYIKLEILLSVYSLQASQAVHSLYKAYIYLTRRWRPSGKPDVSRQNQDFRVTQMRYKLSLYSEIHAINLGLEAYMYTLQVR